MMKSLTEREKRTVRWAAIGLGIYLTLFLGFRLWGFLEAQRLSYLSLLSEAHSIKENLEPFADRALVAKKLMEDFHLDPTKNSHETVVGEASSAIQRAALQQRILLSSIHESPNRSGTTELATLQIEGVGNVPAVLKLLQGMETIGYPLIIDSVQMVPEHPGSSKIKFTLILVILDFEKWKKTEKKHV